MNRKKKKILYLVIGILFIVMIGLPILKYCFRPDGSTMESREEMLKDIPKGTNWKISTERLLELSVIMGKQESRFLNHEAMGNTNCKHLIIAIRMRLLSVV